MGSQACHRDDTIDAPSSFGAVAQGQSRGLLSLVSWVQIPPASPTSIPEGMMAFKQHSWMCPKRSKAEDTCMNADLPTFHDHRPHPANPDSMTVHALAPGGALIELAHRTIPCARPSHPPVELIAAQGRGACCGDVGAAARRLSSPVKPQWRCCVGGGVARDSHRPGFVMTLRRATAKM